MRKHLPFNLVEFLEARRLLATQLVKDINPQAMVAQLGSLVAAPGASVAYFTAQGGVEGGLWKTDGTAGGTVLVTSSIVGASELTPVGGSGGANLLYFVYGGALWKSDGTAGGTVQVSAAASGITDLTSVGQVLYFRAADANGGSELWKTDGTPGGTMRVKDINPGAAGSEPRGLVAVGNQLFFHANDGTSGEELWVSDGSDAGTHRVKDINPGAGNSEPLSLTNVNGTLFFVAHDSDTSGYELWKSDGSETGTMRVKDIRPGAPGSSPTSLVNANGTLYFVATDGQHGFELWKSDGSDGGTVMVSDVVPGGGGAYISDLTAVGSNVFFTADPGSGAGGRELYVSDGTPAGTHRVTDINAGGASSNPLQLTAVGNRLFFTADDGATGWELWTSDGSGGGTARVNDIIPGGGHAMIHQLTALGTTRAVFLGNDGSGPGVFATDGTGGGTSKLANVTLSLGAGSSMQNAVKVGGTIYFTADDSVHGQELWKTDGTPGGTQLVADLTPGPGGTGYSELSDVGGTLYFQALGKLYKSDGSAGGTVPVSDTAMSPSKLTAVGSAVYFLGSDAGGQELWKSDGTSGGTVRVMDINPGASSSQIDCLTSVNGTLYFTADDGSGTGAELWKSDGTGAGTMMVKDIRPGALSSGAYLLTNVNGTLFFRATDGVNGYELWKSDGTPGGTAMVKDIRGGAGDAFIRSLTAVGNTLFFTADDGVHGQELWKSDGTSGETVLVRDIMPGHKGSTPVALTAVNGALLLRADDGVDGEELWKSDGSEGGTVLLEDINPGPGGSQLQNFVNADGLAVFFAFDGTKWDIWRSDGTAAATWGIGHNAGLPQFMLALDGDLYGNSYGVVPGEELYKDSLSVAAAPAPAPATATQTATNSPESAAPAISAPPANLSDPDVFFDTTLFTDKPATLASSGLAGAVLSNTSTDFQHAYLDETRDRALARQAGNLGVPFILDDEQWPLDNRSLSEAVVQMNLERHEQLADWAHDEVPGLKVGFYGLLPTDQYPTPAPDSPAYAAFHAATLRVQPLIDRADLLMPGAYTFNPRLGLWRDSEEAMLAEAATFGKPVRPFYWMSYLAFSPTGEQVALPAEFWRTELDLGRDQADGAIIWGQGAWDENAPWWTITRDFLIDSTSLAPAAPTPLTATSMSTSRIDLTWKDNAYNESGYRVERKSGNGGTFATVTTLGRGVTSFSDTGLSGSTTYTYRVIAVNSNGGGDSQPSNESTARTAEVPPTAPVNPAAAATSATRVNVTWADTATNEQGFAIERLIDGGFAQIGAAPADATSYLDTGLLPGTAYTYRVRAFNSAGNSPYSSEVQATTPTNNSSNLVAQWRLDENAGVAAADSAGSHAAALVGGPTWTSAGELGAALVFDGIDDHLIVADAADLHFTAAQDFTLSAWVNLGALASHRSGIVTQGGTGIWLDAANHWLFGGKSADLVGPTASPGWSLVTAVQDAAAGTRTLYVNGIAVASGVAQAADVPGQLWIGGSETAAPPEFFAGTIDDVRLYARAVSAADVVAMASPHLTLTGSAADDAWTLAVEPAGDAVALLLDGVPQFTRPLDAVGSIDVIGNDGNDTLTLDFTNGDALPLYGLSLDGGAGGNDTLQFMNAGNVSPLVADGAGISRGGKRIARTGVETIQVAGGTMNVSADLAANLIVQDQGIVTFATTQHLPALTIGAGGRANVAAAAAGGGGSVIVAASLSIAPGGTLDLRDNKLATHSPLGSWNGSAYSGVIGLIASGRNGGGWNGAGIVTTSASGNLTTLAVAKAGQARGVADGQTLLFGGETVLGSDTIVMYTWGGDANLDGKINVDDYGRVDFNVNLGTSGWYNGDFNHDGKINVDDYGIIDFNVAIQGAGFPTAQNLSPPPALFAENIIPERAMLLPGSDDAWSNLDGSPSADTIV